MDQFTSVDIYLRFFVAFAIIFALIGLAAWLARFFGFNLSPTWRGKKQKRLCVVDSLPLDAKRRIILISRDEVEHLVCIGGTTDFLIEKDVKTAIPSINSTIIEELNNFSNTQKAS